MASASSPMREALAQLASHGLVQQSNRRGFRLPPLSAAHPVDVLLGKLADRRHRTSARSVTVRPKTDAGAANRAPAAQACRLFCVGLIGWDKIARILRLNAPRPKPRPRPGGCRRARPLLAPGHGRRLLSTAFLWR